MQKLLFTILKIKTMKKLLFILLLFLSFSSCKCQDYIAFIPTVQTYEQIKYGALYNWYAASDTRKISSSDDWTVPTYADHVLISTNTGISSTILGNKLKQKGTTYWISEYSGTDNAFMMNLRGSAYRRSDNGLFTALRSGFFLMAIDPLDATFIRGSYSVYNNSFFSQFLYTRKEGFSIRLVKNTTTLTDGQSGTYTGNDGKVYRTICIGTQEWLADNLAETKFRNGDYIHGYEGGVYAPISNENWAALTTEGMCFYNDDPSTYK